MTNSWVNIRFFCQALHIKVAVSLICMPPFSQTFCIRSMISASANGAGWL
nr:hypothetical protein [Saccharothrix sp. CB00851]